MESVVGAVFPVSPGHAVRIFDKRRTVFVKYTNLTKLARNSRIVFYLSKEKRLIGEGIIEKTEKANPENVWARYGRRIFLNKIEYNQYVSNSPIGGRNRVSEAITAFVLKDLMTYKKTNQLTCRITPAGCYLTKGEYERIIAVRSP
jgi:hypothetical protein